MALKRKNAEREDRPNDRPKSHATIQILHSTLHTPDNRIPPAKAAGKKEPHRAINVEDVGNLVFDIATADLTQQSCRKRTPHAGQPLGTKAHGSIVPNSHG